MFVSQALTNIPQNKCVTVTQSVFTTGALFAVTIVVSFYIPSCHSNFMKHITESFFSNKNPVIADFDAQESISCNSQTLQTLVTR